ERRAGGPRNAADARAALRHAAGRRRAAGRRAHLPARPRARPDRRTAADGRGLRGAPMTSSSTASSKSVRRRGRLFGGPLIRRAALDALMKPDPREQIRNPVMFVVLVGATFTSGLFVQALFGHGEAPASFILAVSLWLWVTVLFANFAEAMAEGRGKA